MAKSLIVLTISLKVKFIMRFLNYQKLSDVSFNYYTSLLHNSEIFTLSNFEENSSTA